MRKILSLSIVFIIALTILMPCSAVFGAGFPDLDASNFAYDAIMQLNYSGVIHGYDDGKFYPDNSLKRSEYCKLITTAMDMDIESYTGKSVPFSDIKESYWGRNYISACYDVKLIDGMGDGTFCPENTLTYEQAVKIAVCAAGLEDEVVKDMNDKWYSGYIETAGENGLLNNTSGMVEKPISRACASQIIYNTFFEYGASAPTPEPTIEPTPEPTIEPTPAPTIEPTPVPTIEPTSVPTIKPTVKPNPTDVPESTENVENVEDEESEDTEADEEEEIELIENLIFIDAGHNYSGMDTGASSGGLREEQLTWQMADKLRVALERNGFVVLMSRETMTTNVANTSIKESLNKRCELANDARAEIFISIHCNAGGGTGVETYCYSKSSLGYNLASCVQDNVIENTGMTDRKVKTANFVVIRDTVMPAILVETGFIDREEDAKIISSEEGQTMIVEGIAMGVCEYKGVLYKAE